MCIRDRLRDLVVDHFAIDESDRVKQIEDKLARKLSAALGLSLIHISEPTRPY